MFFLIWLHLAKSLVDSLESIGIMRIQAKLPRKTQLILDRRIFRNHWNSLESRGIIESAVSPLHLPNQHRLYFIEFLFLTMALVSNPIILISRADHQYLKITYLVSVFTFLSKWKLLAEEEEAFRFISYKIKKRRKLLQHYLWLHHFMCWILV